MLRTHLFLRSTRTVARLCFCTWLLVVGLSLRTRAADPGDAYPDAAEASDQKRGSILFFNFFSSNATNPAQENTELSLTNLNPVEGTAVHLFLVDGTTGTVGHHFMYLIPAQTSTVSLAELAPGKRGYVVAVAIDDATGCPRKFNHLVGTAYIKLATGHFASLPAVNVSALANTPAVCGGASTPLNFDGTNYNRLPRVLSLNNLPSRVDGNDTFLVLNRIGGDFTGTGAAAVIGTVNGPLYDDQANVFAFTLNAPTVPQLAFSLTPSTLQVFNGLDQAIPAGHSGWLKVFNTSLDAAYLGASLNYHPNSATQLGSFDHGHNLTALTTTEGSSAITIPLGIPDAAILMTNSGNFVRGGTANYAITVYNNSTFPIDGTLNPIVVTDGLPEGQTLASFAGGGWNCTGTGTRYVWCESNALLPSGGSLPTLSLTVNIAANAPHGVALNSARVDHPKDVNSDNNFVSNTVTVLPLCPVVSLSPTTLPNGRQGTAYAQTLTASGGVAPYSFFLVSGYLPAGLNLQQNRTLSGVPTQSGIYTFIVETADSDHCGGRQSYTLRIAPDRAVPGDYDGDGFVDLTVWRGSQGTWLTLNSSNGALQTTQWGAGYAPYYDVPVPGDYDGDGKTDLAVFRRSEGNWYIRKSSDGSFLVSAWGLGTDTPVPADYDGDGKTDLAVWRGGEGNWYIRRSSDGQSQIVFWGSANAPYNDVPVVADYDGDKKADIAVFRPGTTDWLIINSSTGQIRVSQWGQAADTHVPADYDGDGKADLVVWTDFGQWNMKQSLGAQWGTLWGTPQTPYHDIAVPGDYDSDGYTDFVVWRPATGTWYIRSNRTGGVLIQAHGQAGDTPLPPR
jgi:hypothetical protein